ncbi:MAG: glycosyltransferase family 2 protein [Cyanothece sp. SIO1E1]|nr:glycosyltransferase family 2 protein [Cyanothece sp. SIO1E1]
MQDDQQLVSVIIPNWNGVRFIAESITSVMRQTYPNWECLVVDDGSTDGSIEIVQELAAADNRVRLIHRSREPKGGSTCRNIGLQASQGDFIIFLDADDVLADYCLQQRTDVFQQYPTCDFLVFPQLLFEQRTDDLRRLWDDFQCDIPDLYRFLRFYVVWQTMAPIYKREFLLDIDGFDENYSRIQDVEFACRILLGNPTYHKVSAVPDCFYRKDLNKEKQSNFRQMRFDNIAYFLNKARTFIDTNRPDYDQVVESLIKLLIFNLDNARELEGFNKTTYAPKASSFIQNFSLTPSQKWRLLVLEKFLTLSPWGERGLLRMMHSLFPKFWPGAEYWNWGKTIYSGELTYHSKSVQPAHLVV